jgi:phosphoketolase
MEEVFKPILGYEGYYNISNKGRVYSLISNKILKTWFDGRGYYQRIRLCKDGKRKSYDIHRLVASTFVSGYREGLEVNHKDEDKRNNNPENLEWVTHAENMLHSQEKIQAAAVIGRKARRG